MKVGQLKALLADLDDDAEVIMADSENGENYHKVHEMGHSIMVAKFVGERVTGVYEADWSAADACLSQEEWDDLLKQPRALVLFP